MTPNELELSLITHTPSNASMVKVERIKTAAKSFGLAILSETPDSREQDLAIRHLEEAVMWASKAIVLPRQERLL